MIKPVFWCCIFCMLFIYILTACQGSFVIDDKNAGTTDIEIFTIVPSLENPNPSVSPTIQLPNITPLDPTKIANLVPSATATQTTSSDSVFQLCSPLAEETIRELWEIISDPYHPPPPGRDERHQGVDFSHYQRKGRKTIEGEVIQAVLPGVVVSTIDNRLPYGNMLIIETLGSNIPEEINQTLGVTPGKSLYLLYAHMERAPQFVIGETLSCGQAIGMVGMTGYNIVNPHLHMEIRIGDSGCTFESMAFYDTSASQDEMDHYRLWRTSGEFMHFDPMLLFREYLLYIGELIP